jgi:hypothetical protein
MRRDRLVTFLYCLIRDEVTPGAIESLFERTIDLGDDAGKDIVYSNPFVAEYAERLAARLLDDVPKPSPLTRRAPPK